MLHGTADRLKFTTQQTLCNAPACANKQTNFLCKMAINVTEAMIEIIPKSCYLSPAELTRQRNLEPEEPSIGLKRTQPKNSEEERTELEQLYEKLRLRLSKPRIERLAGRAVAEFDLEVGAAKIKRKDGKFGSFGYSINGNLYLEFYETLFLLEVNRLQLEYQTKLLSIEQAYLLLLGEQESAKFNEYLVYSHFMRVGYILVKHQNKSFAKQQIDNVEECIWAILNAELCEEADADYVRKCPYYEKTRKQFDELKNKMMQPCTEDSTKAIAMDECAENKSEDMAGPCNIAARGRVCLKRKHGNNDDDNADAHHSAYAASWKKAKRGGNCSSFCGQESLVDFLKDEQEFKQFKQQFQQFDMVPLRVYETEAADECELSSQYKISFDVYLHNEGFRKSSPPLPDFRVIILDAKQRLPTHREMFATYRSQVNAVPLLLVTVNESKQIHAFMHYIS